MYDKFSEDLRTMIEKLDSTTSTIETQALPTAAESQKKKCVSLASRCRLRTERSRIAADLAAFLLTSRLLNKINGKSDDGQKSDGMSLQRAIKEASDKLMDISDKNRWRKQSEEPAPKDGEYVAVLMKMPSRRRLISSHNGTYLRNNELWRPLDLPEDSRRMKNA